MKSGRQPYQMCQPGQSHQLLLWCNSLFFTPFCSILALSAVFFEAIACFCPVTTSVMSTGKLDRHAINLITDAKD